MTLRDTDRKQENCSSLFKKNTSSDLRHEMPFRKIIKAVKQKNT